MNLHELNAAAIAQQYVGRDELSVKCAPLIEMTDEVIGILKRTAEACDECDGTGEVYHSRDPSGKAVYNTCDECVLIRKHAGL